MGKIFYLTQTAADLPEDKSWLTPTERGVLHGFMFEKRRNDWLLGRWTAKQALALHLGLDQSSLARLEVLAQKDGAPLAMLDGIPRPVAISLSHSDSHAICAISDDNSAVGCDIEHIEPRDHSFTETFLTAREQHWVRTISTSIQALAVTLLWSTKESVLKATHEGLTADTWSVEVDGTGSLQDMDWQPLHAKKVGGGKDFVGWWRHQDDFVLTLASDHAVEAPILLTQGHA